MVHQVRRAPCLTFGVAVIVTLLWTVHSLAQEPPVQLAQAPAAQSTSAAPSTSEGQAPSSTTAQGPAKSSAGTKSNAATSSVQQDAPQTPKNDRLFFALPNYQTVENAKQLPPLTAGEKFKLVAKGTFDPAEFPFVGTEALISQLNHSDEASLGQGVRGYAERYAIAFGDTTVGNFMTGAVVPSVLHQDPRYYQLGSGGFVHRFLYAAGRVFIIRGDNGHKQFNASEIFGNAMAGGISNLYHPKEDRTLSNNVAVWYTQTAWDFVGFELKEFWPDLRRLVHRKRGATTPPRD